LLEKENLNGKNKNSCVEPSGRRRDDKKLFAYITNVLEICSAAFPRADFECSDFIRCENIDIAIFSEVIQVTRRKYIISRVLLPKAIKNIFSLRPLTTRETPYAQNIRLCRA
jgi:hypothetical protein